MTTSAVNNLELDITGMTCASCAARLEKALNKLDGVTATVNFALERASVTVPAGYDPQSLVAEVEKAGYTAVLPQSHVEPADDDHELSSLRSRLITAIV